MADSEMSAEEIQRLANMDTKTPQEARIYVMDKMKIGRYIYYKYVYPLIKDEFHPTFIDYDKGKASNVVIPTKRLDEVCAHFKKKLQEHIEQKKQQKDY